VVLANAYLDLGTWWCLTPFVGAGIGGAYNKVSGLTDQGIGTAAGGFPLSTIGFTQTDHTQWNMAWALHAGLAYSVTNNLKLEFAYRYLNMGNVQTSEVLCGPSGCGAPGGGPRAFYTLNNLDSQDFKIGLRWMLQPDVPAYAPAPVYSPPLMRRG
jgi:opacity protein-like surface antigen